MLYVQHKSCEYSKIRSRPPKSGFPLKVPKCLGSIGKVRLIFKWGGVRWELNTVKVQKLISVGKLTRPTTVTSKKALI